MGPPCPGTSSPAARESIGGWFIAVGQHRCKAAAGSFFSRALHGRAAAGPAEPLAQMLRATGAAGDVLEPSLRCNMLRRGRGRLGPGCPSFTLAKFRLLLLNERGTRQERNPDGRRQRGGGGGDGGGRLSWELRQQKAAPLSAIFMLCRDGMNPAQSRRETAELRGTGSRYMGSILPYSKGTRVVKERTVQSCFARLDPAFGFGVIPFVWRGSDAAPLRPAVSPLRTRESQRDGPRGRQHHGPGVAVDKALLLSGPKNPAKHFAACSTVPGCLPAALGSSFPPPKPGLHGREILGHQSHDSASQVLFNSFSFLGYQAELSAQRKSAANPHPAVQPHGLSRARGTHVPGSVLPKAEHHPRGAAALLLPQVQGNPRAVGSFLQEAPLPGGTTSLGAAREERGCVRLGGARLTGV